MRRVVLGDADGEADEREVGVARDGCLRERGVPSGAGPAARDRAAGSAPI